MTLRYCRCCGTIFDADASGQPVGEWVPVCPACRSAPVPTLADLLPRPEEDQK